MSSSSLLHRRQLTCPAQRTRHSSKDHSAGSQSSTSGSRAHPGSCSSEAYILYASALSAATCLQGHGCTEHARRMPKDELRWPCSEDTDAAMALLIEWLLAGCVVFIRRGWRRGRQLWRTHTSCSTTRCSPLGNAQIVTVWPCHDDIQCQGECCN
jgi:hypothetical protein